MTVPINCVPFFSVVHLPQGQPGYLRSNNTPHVSHLIIDHFDNTTTKVTPDTHVVIVATPEELAKEYLYRLFEGSPDFDLEAWNEGFGDGSYHR